MILELLSEQILTVIEAETDASVYEGEKIAVAVKLQSLVTTRLLVVDARQQLPPGRSELTPGMQKSATVSPGRPCRARAAPSGRQMIVA